MRLRRMPEAEGIITESPLVLIETDAVPGAWRTLLGLPSESLLNLEIGMGRGRFIADACFRYPDQGWLGLEMRPEMHTMALRRLKGRVPQNLKFLWTNAAYLSEIFAAGEVDQIYLPFSDPWPKVRHAKRRLTHEFFLTRYARILAPQGRIFFKTDNRDFFFWSQEIFLTNGWQIEVASEDLPPVADSILTEYESRYRKRGLPIYFLEVKKGEAL